MSSVVEDRTVCCFAKNTAQIPEELLILDPNPDLHDEQIAELGGDCGIFSILSQPDGDKRVVWCRKILDQIKAAKDMFMDLISQGMVPYRVGRDGKATSEVMREFDPLAEEVIFMPVKAIAGG